ncbi:MAG: protoporphyrinogen oxidase [Bacilli bacterium]
MSERHVVILGGGITGLTVAFRLLESSKKLSIPLRCTICEQDNRLGGKIQTHQSDEYTVEFGPDSIFTRKRGGVELIRTLDLESEKVPVRSGSSAYVLHKSRLRQLPPGMSYGVPTDLGAMAQTPLLSPLGKIRALADLFLPSADPGEDLSVGDFLRRRLGDELVDVIAAPLLAGIHAGDIDRLSLDATMPLLRSMSEQHRSLILGAMAQSQARSKNGSKQDPPQPMFVTLRDGLESLVDRLAERLDGFAEVRLNTRATGVRHGVDGRYEVTVQSQVQSADQDEVLTADAVVVTIPAFAAATVLTSLNVDSGLLSSIRYVSTATVTLGYAGNVLPPEMTASGFVVPPGEKRVLTACTFVSNKWPHAVRNGHTLIRCYLGRDGDESSVHWSDEQMEEAVRGDLSQILGINAAPETVLISRWMDAMPQYDVGHLNRIKEIDRQVAGYPGLVLAGAAYRGVGIPDCVVDAARAAENVLAYLTSENR